MLRRVLYFAIVRRFDADLVQFGIKFLFFPVPAMYQSTQPCNESMQIHVATAALGRIPRQSLALMRCPTGQKIHDLYWHQTYCLLLITEHMHVCAGEGKIIPVNAMKAYRGLEI